MFVAAMFKYVDLRDTFFFLYHNFTLLSAKVSEKSKCAVGYLEEFRFHRTNEKNTPRGIDERMRLGALFQNQYLEANEITFQICISQYLLSTLIFVAKLFFGANTIRHQKHTPGKS